MAGREISEGWQHPFVSVFKLAKLGSAEGKVNAVGDDKVIGKRCYRIAGAVSAANYLEIPEDPRSDPLNLTGRYVYIQV
ncbi:unnamed protein product [Choristocarpus tenellus]